MSEPSLRGSLASFRLPDVLTFLATARKRGSLILSDSGREAQVFFADGSVVFASSSQESLRLGDVLLRKKRIAPEQREAIDAIMRAEGGARFGELAVQRGVLTQDQLRDFLKIQVSEIIYDCFVWTAGSFAFEDGAELPPYAVTISIDLANLIMEGARRIEEWEECLRLMPDGNVVFRVVSNPESEKITLSLEEWKILFLINGRRTLAQLAAEDDSKLQVYRVVYGLLGNKLIEPVVWTPGPDDTGRTLVAVSAPMDETMRQQPATFGGDSTVREVGDETNLLAGDDTNLLAGDDTNLLVSSDAKLSYRDVVKPTVAQLVLLTGDDEGLMVPLTESEYLLGRQRDNQIQIPDLGVSGHHARIYRAQDGYTVEDLKSRNGTWLNGTRVFHALLRNGDLIRVGATDMRYDVLYAGSARNE
jgi:hypothetical protein